VIDSTAAALDLVGVRFFSTTANYATGDHVIQAGALYKATQAVTAGAFNPAQWTPIGGSITVGDAAPTNPQQGSLWFDSVGGNLYCFFIDAGGPPGQWVVANNMIGAYLPIGGGTLTGPLTLAADPAAALGAATKQYVDGGALGGYGGFVNKLRNGTFDVWQRGTVSAPTGAITYTADGWLVNPTGAAMTVQRGVSAAAAPLNVGASQMVIVGAAGVTAVQVGQRLESYIAAQLAGQTATLQCWVNSPVAVTPQVQASYFNSVDVSSPTTLFFGPVNLQPVPINTWIRLSYTFAMPMNVQNGIIVWIIFPVAITSSNLLIAAADLRATPGLPVGLCANPPPPELRNVAAETEFCQRYYEACLTPINAFSGQVTAGQTYYVSVLYKIRKRAVPAVIMTDGGGSTGFAGGNPAMVGGSNGVEGFLASKAVSTTTVGGFHYFTWTASAEL
jgi:hypothetical protein